MTSEYTLWIVFNIFSATYLLGLSVFLLRHWKMAAHSAEERNIRAIKLSTGWLMGVCSFSFLIYMLPTFINGWGTDKAWEYTLCFLLTIVMGSPALRWTLHSLLQNTSNLLRWLPLTFIPELSILVWFLVSPRPALQETVASCVVLFSLTQLSVSYFLGYRRYMRSVRAEYGSLAHRDLRWTLKVFATLGATIPLFVVDAYLHSPVFDIIYTLVFLSSATFITFCANRTLAVSGNARAMGSTTKESVRSLTSQEKEEIANKLRHGCEETELYLDPELTCDALAKALDIDRELLNNYFLQRGINYFMFINNLRIDYACSLMDEESEDVKIKEIALLSGFKSVREFIDAYKAVIDYIPEDDEDE